MLYTETPMHTKEFRLKTTALKIVMDEKLVCTSCGHWSPANEKKCTQCLTNTLVTSEVYYDGLRMRQRGQEDAAKAVFTHAITGPPRNLYKSNPEDRR